MASSAQIRSNIFGDDLQTKSHGFTAMALADAFSEGVGGLFY